MKAVIVYDTKWGNTEQVAKAIAEGLGGGARALRVGELPAEEAGGLDLLVLGSPVLGGRPSKPMQEFLKSLSIPAGGGTRFATFDTRMTMKFAQRFGHAAVRMAEGLREAGAALAGEPMGFIVSAQKGPLAEGELERAREWGRALAK